MSGQYTLSIKQSRAYVLTKKPESNECNLVIIDVTAFKVQMVFKLDYNTTIQKQLMLNTYTNSGKDGALLIGWRELKYLVVQNVEQDTLKEQTVLMDNKSNTWKSYSYWNLKAMVTLSLTTVAVYDHNSFSNKLMLAVI